MYNSISIDVSSTFDAFTKKYSSPYRLWYGPKLIVYIADAENAELVLKSKDCINKPNIFYKAIRESITTDNLFTMNEENWKIHRRIMSPILNESSIRSHFENIHKVIKISINELPNGEFFDILTYATECKLNVFIQISLGNAVDQDLSEKYMKASLRLVILFCIISNLKCHLLF